MNMFSTCISLLKYYIWPSLSPQRIKWPTGKQKLATPALERKREDHQHSLGA